MPAYPVSVRSVGARPIAVVRARMASTEIPIRFVSYLDQVYAAARSGVIGVDGLNVFVYRDAADGSGLLDIEFGVGATAPFPTTGNVVYSATPAGEVATTTHWGDYTALGGAYDALKSWCAEHGRRLAGPKWEVYDHWRDEPTERRTDVFVLLEGRR